MHYFLVLFEHKLRHVTTFPTSPSPYCTEGAQAISVTIRVQIPAIFGLCLYWDPSLQWLKIARYGKASERSASGSRSYFFLLFFCRKHQRSQYKLHRTGRVLAKMWKNEQSKQVCTAPTIWKTARKIVIPQVRGLRRYPLRRSTVSQ